MSQPLLVAFVIFAAVMYFTPGPNNIIVLSSGLTYGFRPTIPAIAGITFGCAFMVAPTSRCALFGRDLDVPPINHSIAIGCPPRQRSREWTAPVALC